MDWAGKGGQGAAFFLPAADLRNQSLPVGGRFY
jgi:hypothetical protein